MTAAEKFHDLGWRCGDLLEARKGEYTIRVHVHQVGPEFVYGTVVAARYDYGVGLPGAWLDYAAETTWTVLHPDGFDGFVRVGHGMPPGRERTLPPTP